MSTQELARNRPRIGKWILIGAIASGSVAILFLLLGFHWAPLRLWYVIFVIFGILYLLLSCAAAIFYLIREEQAVAARAWGILGAFALALPLSSLISAFIPFYGFISIPALILAIGGAVLVLIRPKLAGVLMLVGTIVSGVTFLFFMALVMMEPFIPGAVLPWYMILWMLIPPLLSISFLVPGGILSLTSRQNQPASRKMVIGTMGALFALPVLGAGLIIYSFPYLFFSN